MIYVAIAEAVMLVIAGITISRILSEWRDDLRRLVRLAKQCDDASQRLRRLRANCFLTDEKGHRRRYADCSEAVRTKAEAN